MYHFNPTTFWMSQAVVCARLMQLQQEFGLRMLAAFAGTVPRPSAAELAAEAEAMKAICGERGNEMDRARSRRPSARSATRGAGA